ncbi:hypothetical protein ACJ73_05755 [Blastomyces percursus]|uniref:Phospholipase/carboxylesterase/thioesterase domain-containing protein n=1 Tax=Blastomyces percursus TaxID=1658174 RepID=A0A1J9Q303_9EURO|nr:hypothetical protein ACJ73_05755 [Blastomyces percursus]
MAFSEPHIVEPTSTHAHTAILLHGRASNGPEFAEELFDTKPSTKESLAAHLPGCRWVFPTSRDRWSSVFQDLTAWFDVRSLTNPCDEEYQSIQVDGLRESTLYVLDILRREIDLLDGESENVILGGVSQGMATALWALMCSPGYIKGNIGGFSGMCGWLPFANKIEGLLQRVPREDVFTGGGMKVGCMVPKFLLDIIRWEGTQAINTARVERILSTPVLLLHGTDDAWIDVELGRQAHRNLTKIGLHVDWVEYSGAENEGHWIREPEGIDAIVTFMEASVSSRMKRGEEWTNRS